MKIEVSNGEIVDKLTILEIKKENSTGNKLDNVMKELNFLEPLVEELDIPSLIIYNLRSVIRKLWDVCSTHRNAGYAFGRNFEKVVFQFG